MEIPPVKKACYLPQRTIGVYLESKVNMAKSIQDCLYQLPISISVVNIT